MGSPFPICFQPLDFSKYFQKASEIAVCYLSKRCLAKYSQKWVISSTEVDNSHPPVFTFYFTKYSLSILNTVMKSTLPKDYCLFSECLWDYKMTDQR